MALSEQGVDARDAKEIDNYKCHSPRASTVITYLYNHNQVLY